VVRIVNVIVIEIRNVLAPRAAQCLIERVGFAQVLAPVDELDSRIVKRANDITNVVTAVVDYENLQISIGLPHNAGQSERQIAAPVVRGQQYAHQWATPIASTRNGAV